MEASSRRAIKEVGASENFENGMKNQYAITLKKTNEFSDAYQIVKIRGAVVCVGLRSGKMFKVGDKITEEQASDLCANKNNDVTITL